jgi:cytochrome c-type biogenesis protein
MEEQLIQFFETMPYLVSFLGGVVTFLSPCVLPLIPAYLSYISGLSVNQINGKENISLKDRIGIAQASLSFILGFSLIFILLGVVVEDTIGDILKSETVAYVAGAIIITFGLHTMKVINIPFLNIEVRSDFGSTKKQSGIMKLIGPFVLGLSFALGWTPCVGPILGTILTFAGQDGNSAITLMTLFALGLGVPFFLSAILTSYAMGIMNKMKQHFRLIEIVSGLLLIVVGIAIAFGNLDGITEVFTDLFEGDYEE